METVYLVIVVVLFLLAASDLIVGVSNDAVNFLNSAVGSKVASFKVIMLVAAIGILIGAVFSSGMMEVARKGIFNPGQFYFSEIMIIFMAVMVTDVLLLDAYNTWGLPTSTTVSIVFELLGAAVGMASIKLLISDGGMTIGQFINSSKALAIISGILLSVGVAFSVGAIIQYLTRIAFSFNFKKRIKYIGAIWGGIAFTALTYFILIKGAKGASFMSVDAKEWIKENSLIIIFYSLIGWTILLQLLYWIFRINILKIIVLVGTFSLAMAFAGNDLVNFIGVPIAGFNSWEIFQNSQGAAPDGFLMTALGGKVPTPEIFLLLAGGIMVLTLYLSKKARSVLKTSIDLSRQDEGEERFKATWISKALVRSSLHASNNIKRALPGSFVGIIEKQFEPIKEKKIEKAPPAFDLIRASVTLTVASVLIAFGT
ncbi:MAG TPA: inorganic phosphate transporter, partial [Bacteroidales bacterium]|nr:inorganic phosphate transporter [Bacteroidales bacterium]